MNDPGLSGDLAKSERFAKDVRRRDFLGLSAMWSFVVTGITMTIGMFRLPMPSVFPEKGSRFRLGSAAQFPPGSTTIIHDRNVLIGHDDEGLYAISLVCTHLGCIARHEADGSFACPCHGSRFDPEGKVTRGPAPSALRHLAMSLSPSGALVVDRAKAVGGDVRFKIPERAV
jgi:cytochrome b6-f complex iron-sulfur subunit